MTHVLSKMPGLAYLLSQHKIAQHHSSHTFIDDSGGIIIVGTSSRGRGCIVVVGPIIIHSPVIICLISLHVAHGSSVDREVMTVCKERHGIASSRGEGKADIVEEVRRCS